MLSVTVLEAQTESKSLVTVELEKGKLDYMTDLLVLYPLQVKANTELKNLLNSKDVLCNFKIDSLQTSYKKQLKKQVRRKNINKFGIVLAFVVALIIK